MPSISFYRDYRGYTGGHQKHCDYIQHALAHSAFSSNLFLETNKANSNPAFDNIFVALKDLIYTSTYQPEQSDLVFLAGLDWQAYLPFFNAKQPVINLIQHIRHGDKTHPLFKFLSHKAIRICVSDAVRDAILPHANGPCVTIKMGHDITQKIISSQQEYVTKTDLYILANKRPAWGREVAKWAQLNNITVNLHDTNMPRKTVLAAMSASKVTLALPNPTEGFYLPGIEAMWLSEMAVTPDCVANREYAKEHTNIIVCKPTLPDCRKAIIQALALVSSDKSAQLKEKSIMMIKQYSLSTERETFHHLLDNVDAYW